MQESCQLRKGKMYEISAEEMTHGFHYKIRMKSHPELILYGRANLAKKINGNEYNCTDNIRLYLDQALMVGRAHAPFIELEEIENIYSLESRRGK